MNKRFLFVAFLFSTALPAIAHGGAVINEIAWMGTANSAQDEWIELAGPSGAILDGWKILTEDGGMSVALSGAIDSAGYFLIERTDDTTVPDVAADFITAFGSGLGNAGDIVVLQNSSGEEVDRVDGSGSWAIGGNNTTKETLQRTLSGWITATATPRAENVVENTIGQEPNNSESDTTTGSGESTASASFPQSAYHVSSIEQKLWVYAGRDRSTIVGALVTFEGRAEDKDGNELNGARFLWNFGDGSTGEGKKALHTYYYPGTYRVFLDVSAGIFSATAALNVNVTPNLLGISEIKPGAWLELINSAPRAVDVSGIGIRINNEKPFYFPRNSFLEAGSQLVLDEKTLGFVIPRNGTSHILYPNGSVFLSISYPAEILTERESLALILGGWKKGIATPGETNKFADPRQTAQTSSVLREASQPKKTQDVAVVQQNTAGAANASAALAQHDEAQTQTASIVLMFGLAISALAGIAIFFLRRFLF